MRAKWVDVAHSFKDPTSESSGTKHKSSDFAFDDDLNILR